jgi:hypothetical protein
MESAISVLIVSKYRYRINRSFHSKKATLNGGVGGGVFKLTHAHISSKSYRREILKTPGCLDCHLYSIFSLILFLH